MLLPELIEYIFTLCSSKDRSILCQVSTGWHTTSIKVSSQLSSLGKYYYQSINEDFMDDVLYRSGDYHLIVRLKRKYRRIYYVCSSGNIDVVNLMILHGVNDWNNGLLGACRGGHLELARLMISLGATNYTGGLFEACKGEHIKLSELMVSLGATGFNHVLSRACSCDQFKMIKFLISKGADFCYNCGRDVNHHGKKI